MPMDEEGPPPSRPPTEQLVARARMGRRDAEEELYRRFCPQVSRRIGHLVGWGSRDTVLDLVQETFASVFRNLHRYRGDGAFAGWVLRIALNTARSHLRSRRRSLLRLWARAEEEEEVPALEIFDARYPNLRAVQQALDGLSPALREAVVLFELEGLSLSELCAALDIPLATAASRVRRGRENLRSSLEKMGYAPAAAAREEHARGGEAEKLGTGGER